MGLITYENLEDGQKVTANVFNERFAQIVAQLNGNIDENNLKNDGISKEKLKAEVYESMYPVGSQYVNFTDPTNPATLLGFGTWQAVAGRVVVGYDAAQSEFNAAEKTGGEKTHQLTAAQLPQLSGQFGLIVPGGHSAFRNGIVNSSGQMGNATFPVAGGSSVHNAWSYTVSFGGNQPHNNLQPYITAYVWKRVS